MTRRRPSLHDYKRSNKGVLLELRPLDCHRGLYIGLTSESANSAARVLVTVGSANHGSEDSRTFSVTPAGAWFSAEWAYIKVEVLSVPADPGGAEVYAAMVEESPPNDRRLLLSAILAAGPITVPRGAVALYLVAPRAISWILNDGTATTVINETPAAAARTLVKGGQINVSAGPDINAVWEINPR